jgi:regulator of RNase E activity RraB
MPMRLPILALALAAALSTGCNRQDDGLVDCGDASDSACNAQVIAGLREAGSDMDAPHVIEFYLYFPTRADADRAAKAIAAKGYETSVDGPDEDKEFELWASRESKLELAAIDKLEGELQQVAKAEKGYYDGWEAAVVE